MIYDIRYSDTDLVFDVHSDYWDYKSMGQLLLYVVRVDEILISSIWDCTLTRRCRTVISIFHVTEKLLKKILLDPYSMYSFTVYHIHGYNYCLLSLLLFTVYTITVYCYTVLLLSLYHPNILGNMNIN